MLRATLKSGVTIALLALAMACSDPLAVDIVAVNIVGDVIVSPDEPATFRVTAVNRSNHRIVWGMGSSSCQLGLVVHIGVAQRQSIDHRACTDDLVEQGLDPGETRIEQFIWGGEVYVDGVPTMLDPGEYRVTAVAGTMGNSDPLLVTVVVF